MDGMNNIFNNRYSKLLTVILIIVIIIVIALLGFLGYKAFNKYTIQEEGKEAVGKFEEELNKIVDGTTQGNIDQNTVIDPNVNLNVVDNNSSSSSGHKVTYKGYEVVGTIEIPKTGVKLPIIKQDDVSPESLKVAICNLYGKLNEPGGNAVLVGHNYRNGTFFSDNQKLSNGDKIYITDNSGQKITYEVYRKYETGSGDFDYATRDVGNKREISLSTCTNDSSKRLVIWAQEV